MSYTSRPPYAEQEAIIRLASRPLRQRPAFAVTLAMFGFTFVLALVLIGGSVFAMLRFPSVSAFAMIMLIVGVAVAGWVLVFGARMLSYAWKDYIFELADDEVRLKIIDRRTQRKMIARMAWEEVDYVEFFTPRDNCTLVFHSTSSRLIEVPMWALTNDPRNVLAFLAEKEIPLVRL